MGGSKKNVSVFLCSQNKTSAEEVFLIPHVNINTLERLKFFFWLCRRVIGHCFLIFGSAEESYIYIYIWLYIFFYVCVFVYLNLWTNIQEKYFYINNYHTHICKVYTGLLLQKELIKWMAYMLRISCLLFCGSSTLNAYMCFRGT